MIHWGIEEFFMKDNSSFPIKHQHSTPMSEEKFRVESDLLGELKVPIDAYYGVQTQRGINNYHISRKKMRDYPDYIVAIAYV